MLSIITNKLNELEKKNNITIIFAVDAGSRSYGCDSEFSDYDIRFVYVHNNKNEYMKISKPNDVIVGFDDLTNLDWTGWDLKKAISHLKESNPSIFEWLGSSIVYVDVNNFKSKCLNVIKSMHTHISLMYHYFNMAKSNWKIWIEEKLEVISKKYFYVIRPLANLIYIMDKYTTNPDEPFELIVNFPTLMININHLIDKSVADQISKLIEKKKTCDSKAKSNPNSIINNWICDTFLKFEDFAKQNKKDLSEIDTVIQSIIQTYKKLSNEVKKINAIIEQNGITAKSNYLTAIAFALQLLWFEKYPNKTTREMPKKINLLIENLDINENIKKEIQFIQNAEHTNLLMDNEILQNQNQNIIIKNQFNKYFIEQGIKFLYLDKNNMLTNQSNHHYDDVSLEKMLDDLGFQNDAQKLILDSKRNDYVDFGLRTFYELLWLLINKDESFNSIPKNIIMNGDPTNTIKNNLLELSKSTVLKIKPKITVEKNKILDDWLESILIEYETKVKNTEIKLAMIKEENIKKRLNNSLLNVSSEKFDEIIISYY